MRTSTLAKSWRIWLLVITIFVASMLVIFKGINFGIDFEGGTMFQLHLAKVPKDVSIEEITNIIERRLNWGGLQDIRVYAITTPSKRYAGYNEAFIFVVVRKSNAEETKRIENLLRKQGKFESLLDGNILFTGEDIVSVDAPGYERIIPEGELYKWQLPFTLSSEAALRFRDMTFHQCKILPSAEGAVNYECKLTYFFIDRPADYIIIVSKSTLENDRVLFANAKEPIPKITNLDELIENIGAPIIVVDKNSELAFEEIKKLSSEKFGIIADSSLGEEFINKLKDLNVPLRVVSAREGIPWLYDVSGLRTVVRLTPSVTGLEPYVANKENAKIITDLIITGYANSEEQASQEREELKILLNSGALPVAVESISKYAVSPTQGAEFFKSAAYILVFVLIGVSAFIFFRYKRFSISLAIIFTALVEAFVTTAFTSALGQSIDIAAITGIIAAVGTGVDDQIVITDELLMGVSDRKRAASLIKRIKRAFFIVVGAAFTTLATMMPIIFLGSILVKIVGFAVAITIGIFVGVLITRPAYGEIAKELLSK